MQFEWYVLNYNCNGKMVERFNIFRNCHVQELTEKAIKKYLRSPSKYKYVKQYACRISELRINREEISLYGFYGLCAEIRAILMNQLWSRREYEISVSDAFVVEVSDVINDLNKYDDINKFKEYLIKTSNKNPKLEKWDCFSQCEPNIEAITRECIWQYKQQLKGE